MRFRVMVKGMPLLVFMKHWPAFLRDYREIQRQGRQAGGGFPFAKLHPCLLEKDQESGAVAPHYFHQDLLVAQRIYQNQPERHVDIGSRIDGFIAHVASFRAVEVFDVRDLHLDIANIRFTRADLMDTEFPYADYCDSLSCLHALEHFGLGRYGDPMDYQGHLRGWENMHRILKKGGKFYFSVPIGPQRIEFNAHRVFSMTYLLDLIDGRYATDAFAYVDDNQKLHTGVELDKARVADNFGCRYGCGIFELTKR